MQTYLDCYPCFLRQALSASKRIGSDQMQERAILNGVLVLLQELELDVTPVEIGYEIYPEVGFADLS